jgi:anhydro-N-acetylmuramic acid kinase
MEAIWTIGVMSGTSLDGVDAAYIQTDGEWIDELGEGITVPYPESLKERLREAFGPRKGGVEALEAELTDFYVNVIMQLIDKHKLIPEVIGLHGQTLHHNPPQTWQLGDGASLSDRLQIPVVYDFRTKDVAAGGQGAPLVPIFHQAILSPIDESMAMINIGGVANITCRRYRSGNGFIG